MPPSVQPPLRGEQAAIRWSSTARPRALWVSEAERPNSARASVSRPVLFEQQYRFPGRADPRPGARCVQLHQRDEAVYLRLGGEQLGEDAAEPERLLDQLGPDPVVAGGCRVALVEDEVDRLQHGGE